MSERSPSSRVLSTTAKRLATASSLATVRECLQASAETMFGDEVKTELIVDETDLGPIPNRGMRFPLTGSQGNVGVILIHDVDPTAANIEVLEGLAAQITMVVQRLRPRDAGASVGRMRAQLETGRQVQRMVLPSSLDDVAFDVAAFYEPFYEVGGDFYEVVTSAPGKSTLLVADASGKGVGAALLMMRLVGEFRVLAQYSDDPAAILEELNRSLHRSPAGDGFVTALCVRLSRFKGSISIANAGHVLPLLRRGTEVTTICEPAPALGMLEEPSYVTEHHVFEGGDMLVLMTDGYSEAFDFLGTKGPAEIQERVKAATDEEHACETLRDAWREALASAGKRAFDDATLVVVRHSGIG